MPDLWWTDLDLVEDGKHSDGVHGCDEGTKEESLEQTKLLGFRFKENSCLSDSPQCNT